MWYSWLADLILCLHISFVLFVVFGGLLVLRWRWIMWLHLPAAVWGTAVELFGWTCPLTPLENWLREEAGETGHSADFLAYYLVPILYPVGLTHDIQIILGTSVLVINISVYIWLWQRSRWQRHQP